MNLPPELQEAVKGIDPHALGQDIKEALDKHIGDVDDEVRREITAKIGYWLVFQATFAGKSFTFFECIALIHMKTREMGAFLFEYVRG